VNVIFQAHGTKKVSRKIAMVAGHAIDARPVFDPIADAVMNDLRRDFEGRGARRWEPLKPETIRDKAAKDQDLRPMLRSHRLEDSLTRRGAPGQVLRIEPAKMELGTTVPYVAYAIGQRPIKLSGSTRARATRLLRAWIIEPWGVA
jgi:transposase InsO family protein